MPSGNNQIATNISSRKCKNENVQESYASVTRLSKKVHKSIQKKDEQLERSIEDSADFVIKSKHSYENKSVRDSKVDFSELLRSLRKDDRSIPKGVEKPPESLSTSGSINTAGNMTSRGDLDSWDEELVNILHDLHKSQRFTAKKPPKSVNGRLKGHFCSKTVFNLNRKVLTETEIRVLDKCLGFAPTPTRINESDLKRNFNKFS